MKQTTKVLSINVTAEELIKLRAENDVLRELAGLRKKVRHDCIKVDFNAARGI